VIPSSRFDQLAELGFPTSFARQAIEKKAVVFVPDLGIDPSEPHGQSALLLNVRSVLCVPGLAGDEVIALTYLYRSGPAAKPFDQQDVQLAIAISHQAALTVQRTQLLEKSQQLEQLAMTDPLTGLANRRRFLELAEKEFQRARRYRRPLSAMMLDVDGFKQFNDSYGRAVGDQVLRGVAERCQESLRESNLLARYGPDEFVVLLLECDLAVAQRVATRLHRRTAAAPITTDAGAISVGVSTGCAELLDDVANLHSLIALADAALFLAKSSRPTSTTGQFT
jgi:diguanylate cyclase (GGDEF)-like protein